MLLAFTCQARCLFFAVRFTTQDLCKCVAAGTQLSAEPSGSAARCRRDPNVAALPLPPVLSL